MNAGEYLRLSAQGDGATLTCLLRVLGSRIAQVSSLGGTGGTATLAAYFEEAAKVELEIRRTEKSAAPTAIRAEIAAQRQATTSDIAEASAYRAFTSAKTPDELDAVIRSATDVGATELTAAAVLAEVRKLFGAGQYQAGLDLAETRLAFARGFPPPALRHNFSTWPACARSFSNTTPKPSATLLTHWFSSAPRINPMRSRPHFKTWPPPTWCSANAATLCTRRKKHSPYAEHRQTCSTKLSLNWPLRRRTSAPAKRRRHSTATGR